MADEPNELVKVSFNLPREELDALRELAESRNVPVSQALRQAIATERFIDDQIANGDRILVETSKGRIREVVFATPEKTRRAGMKSR
jgi:hypothetical protein